MDGEYKLFIIKISDYKISLLYEIHSEIFFFFKKGHIQLNIQRHSE